MLDEKREEAEFSLNHHEDAPLVVDLDGTLIKTDLLHETAFAFATRWPWAAVGALGSLGAGRAALKACLAKACPRDAAVLPYNRPLLAWLQEQRARGRILVLATGSDQALAQAVAKHLGLFDKVLASDGRTNLRAQAKRDALVELYGPGKFDYVGNDAADLPVWEAARVAYAAGAPARIVARLEAAGKLGRAFSGDRAPLGASLLRALRPHQWVKSLLVFIPLLAAHRYADPASVGLAALGCAAFILAASAIYLFNDLVDVDHDRHHAAKRARPFAAGDLHLFHGLLAAPVLLAGAFIVAAWLPAQFVLALLGYCALSVAYSLLLKRVALLDVLTLSGLYTVRIMAGAAAIAVPLSFWLLAFSMFVFLSLAFIKRYCEVKDAGDAQPDAEVRGRGYAAADLAAVSMLGCAAGYIAILVLALYIQEESTVALYKAPRIIWLACPLLLYWISRAWLLAHRGKMHNDPIVFALKDPISWLVGVCLAAVLGVARYTG